MKSFSFSYFEKTQNKRGIPVKSLFKELDGLCLETPSWGYGDSGTRFKVFKKQGVPRNPFEKLEDAAQVHRFTGICPSVALHIPWDKVDDFSKLKNHARNLGVKIGAINPNLFQDDLYMLGSVCHVDSKVRRKALLHLLECVEIARETGSEILSLWFADGTNYPGQDDFRRRKHHMEECLKEVYRSMPKRMRMLIEYKFYEPAFYHTDLADWGMAYNLALKLGPQAEVLVDTGHHAQGTNVEHIVAYLIDEGRLGGFHFNARKYGDDDLIVGSINPYEIFLIFHQIRLASHDRSHALAKKTAERISYMIDQSHCIEPKIPAMIRSVLNIQTQFARALLVNEGELKEAQQKGDVLRAEAAVREAFEQDVTPLLQAWREKRGIPKNPMEAFLKSGYIGRIQERGSGGASW